MEIKSSGTEPPHDYSKSSLSRPKGRVDFDRVVRSIRRFTRDSILEMGARILWHIYRNPKTVQAESPGYFSNVLALTYGDSVIMLACMYASEKGRAPATELEFRLLCWELHSCVDYVLLRSEDRQRELTIAQERYRVLRAQATTHGCFNRIPESGVAYSLLVSALGRMAAHRWHAHTRVDEDRIRACLIYEEMTKRCPDIRAIESVYFRTTYDRFVWCCIGLAAFANRDLLSEPCPGFVRFAGDDEEQFEDEFHVTVHDMATVADILASDFATLRSLAAQIAHRPAWQRPHCPELRRLSVWPLVRGPSEDLGINWMIPSPAKLLAAASDRLLFDFVDFARLNTQLPDVYVLRGQAFGTYVKSFVNGRADIVDVDSLSVPSGRRPDFLWIGSEFGIVLEIKFGLSPNEERYFLTPTAVVESWRRGAGAVDQASQFLSAHTRLIPHHQELPRRWILVIVTYEDLARETSWFDIAAKRFGLLADTGLEALHIESASSFERFVTQLSADAYAQSVIDRWQQLNPSQLSQPVLQAPDCDPPASYTAAWKRLLPHLACPWSDDR